MYYKNLLKKKISQKLKNKIKQFKNFLRLSLQNKKIIFVNKYLDYSDYLQHQKNKTLDPQKIQKWLGEEWEIKYNGFLEIFNRLTKDSR